MLPIDAASSKEDIRLFQGRAGLQMTGEWDQATIDAAKQIAVDSGTGDPLGKDGVHCNAVMFNYITLVWIAAKGGNSAVDSTARAEAKRANDRISGIVIPK